jgi:hypothetical protein
MVATRKNRKKYDAKSALVIKQLAAKHKVTESFVRLAINGDRDSETATTIRKEYPAMLDVVNNAIDKALN